MNEQILAKRLKELRESMNLTQSQFGDLINVAQTTLSSYENGSKTPNIDTLYNIAIKCNISIDWLCGLSDIHKTKDFSSYSDIFNLIVNICKSIHIDIEEYHYSQDEYDMSLIVKNPILNEYNSYLHNAEVKKSLDDLFRIERIASNVSMGSAVASFIIDKYTTDTLKYDNFVIDDMHFSFLSNE